MQAGKLAVRTHIGTNSAGKDGVSLRVTDNSERSTGLVRLVCQYPGRLMLIGQEADLVHSNIDRSRISQPTFANGTTVE